VAKLDR